MYPAAIKKLHNPTMLILRQALHQQQVSLAEYRPFVADQKADILHVHWPERALLSGIARYSKAAARLFVNNLLASANRTRQRGGKVFWTVHNLMPHAALDGVRAQLWNTLMAGLTQMLTDVIVMDDVAADDVARRYPGVKPARHHIIPIPHYRAFFDAKRSVSLTAKFAQQWPGDTVLLMAGHIKPYKGLEGAIEVFKRVKLPNMRLVLAGQFPPRFKADTVARIGTHPSITLIDEFLSDEKLIALYDRADIALFNFSQIHNSGSVLAALSLNTPVIAPKRGLLHAMQQRVGRQAMHLFEPDLTPDQLSALVQNIQSQPTPILPDLSYWDPQSVAHQYRAAYLDHNHC